MVSTIRHGACAALLIVGVLVVRSTAESIGGGGAIPTSVQCISAADRDRVAQQITQFGREHGLSMVMPESGVPPKLTFFPLAGSLWGDLFTVNYVDLNPTSGILDWDCSGYSYDGHQGNDTDIRSFAEQVIGVPVYAAQDGVVIGAHDGEFDMNTTWNNQAANFVVINHGFGRQGWYWHLKRNSVAVTVGQLVRAGEQIGLCASSGVSTGPHLHFQLMDGNGVEEPYTGDCHPGESAWADQTPLDRTSYLHDFAVAWQNLAAYPGWPFALPTTGQIALTDPSIRIWFFGTALPEGSDYRVQYKRPDGTIAYDSVNQNFGNPEFWRWYWWWWTYNVPDMHVITGTWHILLSVNGELMIEAPIEVREQRTADFNRPPEPIGLALEPELPVPDHVTTCCVETSLTLDDLDYDIVRYEYVWTADDVEVRRVTTAAHSDVLPHHVAKAGENLICTVTPGDGRANGPTASVSSVVGCGHTLDDTCDGDVDLLDYSRFADCATGPDGGLSFDCRFADGDDDGDCDLHDFGILMQRFSGDCGVLVTQHPVDVTACPGSSARFSVAADGTQVSYQWRRNGISVPGGTSPTLVINPVTNGQAGTYLAYLQGSCSVDYSRSARLSIHPPPVVIDSPDDSAVCLGEPALFSVSADGVMPLTYQWYHNDVLVPGATAASHSIPAVTRSDLGEYRCVVTDGCSIMVAATASLTLASDSMFTTQPADTSACVGEIVFLLAGAEGATSFQWYKDDRPIPGATSTFFIIVSVVESDAGVYHVEAEGQCGPIVSDDAVLEVIDCGRAP